MPAFRPATKAGIVAGGFVAAAIAAALAVWIRVRLTQGPAAQASSGMHAFGDLFVGLAVFGALALGPFALALYWLRPVGRFWQLLARAAVAFVVTAPPALVVSGWLRAAAGTWALLADTRLAVMPLASLALAVCGIFAPETKGRLLLYCASLVEGGIFATLVFSYFIWPQLTR